MMKKRLNRLWMSLLAAGLSYTAPAQTQVVNLSTGIHDATNTLMAEGTIDDTWEVLIPGASTYINVYAVGQNQYDHSNGSYHLYWDNWFTGRWVSHQTYTNGSSVSAASNTPVGYYTYRATFNMSHNCVSTAILNFDRIGGDDEILNISINGHNHSTSGMGLTFGSLNLLSYNNIAGDLVAGTNTIEITVYNALVYNGLAIEGGLTINYYPVTITTPSFTVNNTFCEGTPVTVDGSGTTIIDGPFYSHLWTIRECDQYGNITSVNAWGNVWQYSAPGVYTFPLESAGGPHLECGKYYLVQLSLDNYCEHNVYTTHVVYIGCKPVFNLNGSTTTICAGGTAYIVPNISSPSPLNCTMTIREPVNFGGWTFYIPVYLNGAPVAYGVMPLDTTTYEVTITDSISGCSTTVGHTVYVTNDDPSFSLSANTSNAGYMTLTGTPNVTSGLPGTFLNFWSVEELDASLNPVYYTDNNSCMPGFNIPYTNVFNGIDGTALGYAGAITCGSPAVGQFKYNTDYRITRFVYSEECNWQWHSLIVRYAKSGDGLVMQEDKHGPGYHPLMGQLTTGTAETGIVNAGSAKIFPNPNNGQFVLEITNMGEGNVFVFDAMGKKVKTIALNGATQYNVDLSTQAKGIYTLVILSGTHKYTEKIIVE